MCTSVPQTPARRTRMSTSSSRIFGSGTSFITKPGPADCFTRAFTGKKLHARSSACVASRGQFDDSRDQRVITDSVLLGCAGELGVLLEVAIRVHLDDVDGAGVV